MRLVIGGLIMSMVVSAGAHAHANEEDAAKRAQCEVSADLIGAVQQARLDRVGKRKAAKKVLESRSDWPANIGNALPTLVEYVYSLPRKDLKTQDLAKVTRIQCLQQYDQAQDLTQPATN